MSQYIGSKTSSSAVVSSSAGPQDEHPIDNSGSMGSNQTNIKNNFDSFINAFNLAGVDYHIALVTTDEAAFVGDIITPLTSDPILEFNNQVDSIGTHGSPIEKGLYYSFMATYPGGDAAPGSPTGFFRSWP